MVVVVVVFAFLFCVVFCEDEWDAMVVEMMPVVVVVCYNVYRSTVHAILRIQPVLRCFYMPEVGCRKGACYYI